MYTVRCSFVTQNAECEKPVKLEKDREIEKLSECNDHTFTDFELFKVSMDAHSLE